MRIVRVTFHHKLICSAVLLALAGCANGDADTESTSVFSIAEARAAQEISTSADPRRQTPVTKAVARVSPAVVTVQTEIVSQQQADPFAWFFGESGQLQVTPGLGTGFIVRSDGTIVTNAHVVEGARSISVALSNGKSYPAKLLGADEPNDIAVLKIDADDLPVAPMGSSSDLLIGETVIAIGNPYGFVLGNPEPSVTTGVVSATGRNLIARTREGQLYLDMIQTDAAINPGNSGGPLVNVLGEVIGMNSSIFSPSGGSIGLGFAIPINRVVRVADDLLAHGFIRRPWVGIKMELPESNNPRDLLGAGVVVARVVPGSPAAQGGVRPGDVVRSAGGKELHSPYDWEALLLDLRVGDKLPLQISRGGRDLTLNLTVKDLPEVSAPRVEVMQELELVTMTRAIRGERGIRADHGALVVRASDRITNEIGLRAGDVIVQVNRQPIDEAEEVRQVLEARQGRGVIRVYFERSGRVYSTDFILR